jgi:CMP-N-acetylneuraminic acid synthetase|tara:strand:+ start:708 stop:1394 length:687 start_codon:yes stop_codon:yes gene_type:complete
MNVLAIIPARSGSKGIKNKNIKKINNITLIERAYIVAKKSKIFDKIIISTDSPKYQNLMKKKNIDIFSLRSKKNSSDKSTDLQLLKYEIKKNEKIFKKKFSIIALLQPTSPMRNINDLKKCFQKIKKKKLDAVWTLSKIDKKFNPIKLLKIQKDKFDYYDNFGKNFVGRQLLNQYYIRNGIAYFFSRKSIVKLNTILPKKNGYIIINRKIVNIDDAQDLRNAQKILQK